MGPELWRAIERSRTICSSLPDALNVRHAFFLQFNPKNLQHEMQHYPETQNTISEGIPGMH